MIDRVNAFALIVQDVRKMAEFYKDKLGFKIEEVSDGFAYLKFGEAAGPGLALVSRSGLEKEFAENSNPGFDLSEHGFYFASFLKNADNEKDDLTNKGVKFVTKLANRPDGQRYAFFEDPEGNMWEISHFPQ